MGKLQVVRMVIIIGVLLLCSYEDIREKKISVYAILAGIGVTLVLDVILKDISLVNVLLGGTLGILLVIVSKLTRGAFGLGDAMLLGMIGISLGAFQTLLVLFYGLLITSVVSVVLLLLKRVKKQTQMPFVPFILLGYLGVIFSC